MRLAKPPPARLAIPAPTQALLTDEASQEFALAMADDLQAQEVPAVAKRVTPGDWQLVMTAEQRNGTVVPVYTVQNPSGVMQGKAEGKPIPLAEWATAAPDTLKQTAA